MNDRTTAALRELITAELAVEQPGRDPAAAQARLARARQAYEQALANGHAWEQALGSAVTVPGTPAVQRRRRRPRPSSPASRRLHAGDSWQHALGG